MMRPSRTIRRGTLLVFALAIGALFVSASSALAAPREFDDPQGSGNFLYTNFPESDQSPASTIEIGICFKSDQGPLKAGYYYLNIPQSDPNKGGGSPLPGSPGTLKPCPTNGAKQSAPIQQTPDGGIALVDPTNQLISSPTEPGFLYAKPDQAAQTLELGLCVKGGPTPLATGYYYLNIPQSDPMKGGGSPLPGSPGTVKPCPTIGSSSGGGGGGGGGGTGPKDTDQDGVPDSSDNCPTVQGPPSNGGCPAPAQSSSSDEAPNTKASGPKSTTNPRPTFKLSSNESGAKFECRIDKKGKFKSCKKTFRPSKALKPGKHVLEARAVKNGKRDQSPAKRKFTVKP